MTMKRHPKALYWDDERADGNSLIVTTKYGWAFVPHADENVASHVKGFDTVAEARRDLNRVKECNCARCTRRKGG